MVVTDENESVEDEFVRDEDLEEELPLDELVLDESSDSPLARPSHCNTVLRSFPFGSLSSTYK